MRREGRVQSSVLLWGSNIGFSGVWWKSFKHSIYKVTFIDWFAKGLIFYCALRYIWQLSETVWRTLASKWQHMQLATGAPQPSSLTAVRNFCPFPLSSETSINDVDNTHGCQSAKLRVLFVWYCELHMCYVHVQSMDMDVVYGSFPFLSAIPSPSVLSLIVHSLIFNGP